MRENRLRSRWQSGAAAVHFGEDYAHHANQSIITMAMVETAEAPAALY